MAPVNAAEGTRWSYRFTRENGTVQEGTFVISEAFQQPENDFAGGISVQYLSGPYEGFNQHFTPAMWEQVEAELIPTGQPEAPRNVSNRRQNRKSNRRNSRKSRKNRKSKSRRST